MVDKILLKTIKVTIGNCLIYMPKVIRLFFKPLPQPFTAHATLPKGSATLQNLRIPILPSKTIIFPTLKT
jgi:hypothetical protein